MSVNKALGKLAKRFKGRLDWHKREVNWPRVEVNVHSHDAVKWVVDGAPCLECAKKRARKP